ncbi:ADP-ribosylglycohydrolase family protein [Desulfobacter postgatei]|uniref:ADP-ribosylglycohydrolase family protein n=1 Tax=Desulfobacter postgatei TaxID=2293 RepID=UPI00259B0AEE|nr:ADP-ribosylglycohydrolase family protein [uncultured Desulfobacter sp.]
MTGNERIVGSFKGCLLGGAVGDALGASIEFQSLSQIQSIFGQQGLTEYEPAYGRKGAITDDTQMSLFTAEGLILSRIRPEYNQGQQVVPAIYHALLRWLYTQDTHRQNELIKTFGSCSIVDGILLSHRELFSQRAPGNSCLSSLRSGNMGTMSNPINDSKGCGGVMRSAPVGLVYKDSEKAFQVASECAAITHGHPTGYLAAGTLSALISRIISGDSLLDAIDKSILILKTEKNNKETLASIDNALNMVDKHAPGPDVIENIGAGWVAEEALAISIYCALIAKDDFKKGVLLSVNHSGDSDSTGSITGNILGALYGVDILPENWVANLELKDLIEEIAGDLFAQFQ